MSKNINRLGEHAIRTGEVFYTSMDPGRGMTDYVRVYIRRGGQYRNVTESVAGLIGASLTGQGRIRMGGYGYNKEFEVVYRLGRVMRPDFRCTGTTRCPSNDHVNEWSTPDYRKGRKHSDGGYAFRQSYAPRY